MSSTNRTVDGNSEKILDQTHGFTVRVYSTESVKDFSSHSFHQDAEIYPNVFNGCL